MMGTPTAAEHDTPHGWPERKARPMDNNTDDTEAHGGKFPRPEVDDAEGHGPRHPQPEIADDAEGHGTRIP